MLVRGKHSIRVFVRRISVEIEHRMPFHNPLKLLRKLRPPLDGLVVDRTKEWPYQRLDNAIGANNLLPFLVMILLVPRVGRALLFIACRTTEPLKGSVHKALEHSALLSSRESCCLSAIY